MSNKLFTKKIAISLILSLGSIVGIYMQNIATVGDTNTQTYFNGAPGANSTYPVTIMGGNTSTFSTTPSTTQQAKSSTTLRIPLASRCATYQQLCDKIKFLGTFTDAEKRDYQSLVIRQIQSIDSILSSDTKIADVLYSITLDASKGSRRGWAGNATIIINLGTINSQEELQEILTHELGHIVDLSILQGTRRSQQTSFSNLDGTFFSSNDPSLDFYTISWLNNTTRKNDAGALGFVGGYAMSDPFEDFAETFNMYLNHHNVFAILTSSDSSLKKKYAFMQNVFNSKFLKADVGTAVSMKDDVETRPWDTTRGY